MEAIEPEQKISDDVHFKGGWSIKKIVSKENFHKMITGNNWLWWKIKIKQMSDYFRVIFAMTKGDQKEMHSYENTLHDEVANKYS